MTEAAELSAENARLAARVVELEAQLAAKPVIDRMTLYRMANNAPWGMAAANPQGVLDYANPGFAPWLTAPPPAFGLPLFEIATPALREALEGPFRDAVERGLEFAADLHLRDVAGEMREVRLRVYPRGRLKEGITGALIGLYDVTETQALDRSVRENEARLTHINAVTPSVIYIFDVDLGYPIWAGGRSGVILGVTPEELPERGPSLKGRLVHPDDRPVVFARLLDLNRLPDGEVCEAEYRVYRPDGSVRWVLDRAVVFERDADGRVIKTLSAALDIDERKQAEARRTLLLNELNHRVKNTLAAVQSIARQSLRSGRPAEEAEEQFTARLVALSAAHDVLTRENWEGAGLHEIVSGALTVFSQGQDRISVDGPEVRLSARVALALAMALHELGTNAVKYGALSGETGRIELSWRAHPQGDGGQLELEWREKDGPLVTPPREHGFGSRLLRHGLATELDGAAELDFAPDGLVCRIRAPIEAMPRLDLTA